MSINVRVVKVNRTLVVLDCLFELTEIVVGRCEIEVALRASVVD